MSKHKDYVLYLERSLWKIKLEGGGQLAAELSGSYTSQKDAHLAINNYEAKKKPCRQANRKVKNGESKDTD
jgi:hypothetical protein